MVKIVEMAKKKSIMKSLTNLIIEMYVIKLTFPGWLYKEERSENRDGTP